MSRSVQPVCVCARACVCVRVCMHPGGGKVPGATFQRTAPQGPQGAKGALGQLRLDRRTWSATRELGLYPAAGAEPLSAERWPRGAHLGSWVEDGPKADSTGVWETT